MYGLGLLTLLPLLLLTYAKMHQFPGDKSSDLNELGIQPVDPGAARKEPNQLFKLTTREDPVPVPDNNTDRGSNMDSKLIDLNARPQRIHGEVSNDQEQGMDFLSGSNHESASVVSGGFFRRETER